MSTRYLSNLTLMVAGGFLVVATQAFAAPTVAWLTFGIATGATIVGLSMLSIRPTIPQGVIGSLTVVLGAWTLVASVVFVPATVLWLGFAAGIAFVGLGVVGLTAHELTTERVVHSLDFDQQQASRRPLSEREPVAA